MVLSVMPEDAGQPTLLMQYLKFLTPVECIVPNYDFRIKKPEVGEFLMKKTNKGQNDVYKHWKYVVKDHDTDTMIARFIGINS